MTVLDAYAVIALLRGESAAREVEALLTGGDTALTAIGVGEVLDRMIRLAGVDEEEASLDLAELGLLDSIAVTGQVGTAAGRLRARHYHRTRCAISMADCVAAETARALGEAVATSDPDLLDVCLAEGIASIVLPQSDGSVWGKTP